jgi:ubiquinone/menaquinone biosynthesis C-methylase UbiE
MSIISRFMRFFFHHLYHSFAWTYDFVSAVVSIGRWNDWIQAILPFIQGTNLLEIGHGPGKLQCLLRERGLSITGLDESIQMIQLAKKRLKKAGYKTIQLTRGLAQLLPFPDAKFDCIISTFPSEFIFDPRTLAGIYRVLQDRGRFIIVPAAWISGQKFLDRTVAWLFRITGETPKEILEVASARFINPLQKAGFKVEAHRFETRSSIVLILTASKNSPSIELNQR